EVLIERVAESGGAPVWKFAASTVAAIPDLYAEFGWGPLARFLPEPFFRLRFLEIRLWQWVAIVLLGALAWLVSRVVHRPLVMLTHWALAAGATENGAMAEQSAAPLRLLIAVGVFAAGAG